MDSVPHLPGCDLRHKPRQRCSSWELLREPVREQRTTGAQHRGPDSAWGYLVYSILPLWIVMAIWLGLFVSLVIFAMVARLLGHPVSFGS